MTKRRDDEDSAQSPFARALARAGARPSKTIELPGMPGTKVALWCPNDEEEAEADVEASKRLTAHHKMSALDLTLGQATDLFQRERDIELITLVARDPDDADDAFFESSDEARQLARPQRRALIAAIEDFQRERFMSRTPEVRGEVVRLVREAKQAGVLSNWLVSCESATELREIIEILAEALDSTPSTTSNSSND